jgi:hypothetical protein
VTGPYDRGPSPESRLRAVGQWYADFRSRIDDEVVALLAAGRLTVPDGAEGVVVFAPDSAAVRLTQVRSTYVRVPIHSRLQADVAAYVRATVAAVTRSRHRQSARNRPEVRLSGTFGSRPPRGPLLASEPTRAAEALDGIVA